MASALAPVPMMRGVIRDPLINTHLESLLWTSGKRGYPDYKIQQKVHVVKEECAP